jgi:aminoglycoside phosphotransferase (APT) family kinase protein
MASRIAPHPPGSGPVDFATPLLSYLRARFETPGLVYAAPPAPLAGGFDTSIYTLEFAGIAINHGPLVLRVFGLDDDPRRAQFEATVHDTLSAQGYPVPRIIARGDGSIIGRSFLLMERLPGRTMLDAMMGPGVLSQPRTMGILHGRLHSLDPAPLRAAFRALGAEDVLERNHVAGWRGRISDAQLHGLMPALDWIDAHRPPSDGSAICHGDFHPMNIIVDGRGGSGVVDWSWVRIGPPAWDVGAAVAIFHDAPVNVPAVLRRPMDWIRRVAIRRYLKAYRGLEPLDESALAYYRAERYLGFLIEAGEHIQAAAGIIDPIVKPTAFGDPYVHRRLCARIRELTGVRVRLPAPRSKATGSYSARQ